MQTTQPVIIWWHELIVDTFFSQFFDVQRKDFWEMFIHHNTTIALIALSWTAHFTRVIRSTLLKAQYEDFCLCFQHKCSQHIECSTGGHPGDPGARLLRPLVGVRQTFEVHRLPTLLWHLFRTLRCHLDCHQVRCVVRNCYVVTWKHEMCPDAACSLRGSYTLQSMTRATSLSSPLSTTSSWSSLASCSCSTSSGPSCWSRRSEVPSFNKVLTTVAVTASRLPWTKGTRTIIWIWRKRIDIQHRRNGSP